MGGCCAGCISLSFERDESNSTAKSVTIRLAGCATSLSSHPLIRLLLTLILAADHQMTHWGRLPESSTEATPPDRFNEGKNLAPACLIVGGTDNFLCTKPRPRDHEAADEHNSRGCQALCRISCGWGASITGDNRFVS